MNAQSTVSDTTEHEVEALMRLAAQAAPILAATDRAQRAAALRAVADDLDQARAEVVALAMEESHLPQARLEGEVGRTTGQLRMFAEGLEEEDGLVDAIIDTADPQAAPVPRPDLRRMQVPLGPVVIFAASNFPFAFSVAGGDTAAALAAGCPIVVKTHPGHPRTSARTGEIVQQALSRAGMPEGSFALVHGQEAGVAVLTHPVISAGSFTGSIAGGRALFDIASAREVPIPFYAEMGSINPTFVTPAAAEARPEAIATGFVESFTLGVGQFCTKPGLLFLPRGSALKDAVVAAADGRPAGRMLMPRIFEGHQEVLGRISSRPGVEVLVNGSAEADSGSVSPTVLSTDVQHLVSDDDELLTECFGPTTILVEYDGFDDALRAADVLEGNLTATLQGEPSDAQDPTVSELVQVLQDRAGRVLWNGWPTGVAVSWAQHHGGPYPATTAPSHTSVGMTAVRRFQRPVVYQDFPQDALPVELRDPNPGGLVRRINGRLSTQDVG